MERPGQGESFEYRPTDEEWVRFIAEVEGHFERRAMVGGGAEILWDSEDLGKQFMLSRSVIPSHIRSQLALYNLYIRDTITSEHSMISFGEVPRGVAVISGEADEDANHGISESPNESAEILLRLYLSTIPYE